MKFQTQHVSPDIREQINRKRNDDLIEIVSCFIDMVALWPYLIQTGIFKQDDPNISTWSRSLNNPDTLKDIFSTIKTKEPDDYKNLILSYQKKKITKLQKKEIQNRLYVIFQS